MNISTRTVIGVSNINCNIESLYEHLPVKTSKNDYNYIPIKKKRGRRRKNDENKEKIIEDDVEVEMGDIVGIYYKNNKRGIMKYLKNGKKYFRNALNVIMMLSKDRKINFKLSKNGKIQMTGCKHDDDPKICLQLFFQKLFEYCRDHIECHDNHLDIIYYTVMTNIDFNIGFNINRQKLNNLINQSTEFNSLLETSFGYTGVNIKVPFVLDTDIMIDRLQYYEDGWHSSRLTFMDFIRTMDDGFKKQELEKKRYNTFLVFHSGNIIMSGMRIDLMTEHYRFFMNYLKQNRALIEELLHT